MTLEQVFAEVERIQAMAGDPEAAHSAEDKLWGAVLEAIAGGADGPHLLAMAALHTKGINFPRRCA